jgi:tetratricopeptide (TPR) repeat protein
VDHGAPDVLSLLFLLLAVIAYLRRHAVEPSARARALWLAASLAAFVLSLASKAWGITLPVVLLVLDVYPLRRPLANAPRAIVAEKIPYLLIAVPFAAMALVAQTEALAPLSQHTLGARLLQSVQGLWFYLMKTVAPFGLTPIYELEAPGQWLSGALLPIAGLAALTAFAIARRRAWPGLVTALACYAIIVSPVLGFFQSGSQKVADRYSYVACLPWACLLAALLESGLMASRPWPSRAALAGLAIAVLAALGVLTFRQTRYWRSSLALWQYALTQTPGSAIAQFNMGYALQQTGDQKGAIEHYVVAVERLPQWAKLQSNLGMAYVSQREYDLALQHLDDAVRLDASDFHAFTNRGLAHRIAASSRRRSPTTRRRSS